MTEDISEKTLAVRKKAVNSHDFNSPIFQDRYAVMDENPYASAFAYGRKKLYPKMFEEIDGQFQGRAKVLDVACGTGYFTSELRKKGYDVTGVEPAEGMRKRAQEKNPDVEIVEGIVSELPFEDDTFDLVTAVELFRYLDSKDIMAGYEEILRVLKPGGIMVVTLVNRYALDGFIFSYYAKLMMEKLFGKEIINYCNFVTPSGMEWYFGDNFKKIVKTESTLFAPLRIVYKIKPSWGEALARKFETLDEKINTKKWHQKFAGHLIVTVKK